MINSIDNKSWDTFVKRGTIDDKIISKIANSIRNGRPLTTRELAIYKEHSTKIELKIKKFT